MNRRAFLGALAATIALAACRKKRSVPPEPHAATRIVSLSPSTTETVFAIGAGARLVGRSRYCDWPPEVTKLPQVGGYVDPSFEAILALSPDLVTGARGPAGDAITRRLASHGIATYFPETESIAAITEMIEGLGARAGAAAEAARVAEGIERRLAAMRAAQTASGAAAPRVLLVFGLEPLSVAGPGSFANEMIERAGGLNVVERGGAYPTIGVEHVLALDPDVIVNAAIAERHGKERLGPETPGWSKVRAVAEGHVRAIGDESVLRPGPRIVDGIVLLERAIHDGIAPTSRAVPAP